MQLVWACLKTVEAVIGMICLIIHIIAINDAEPIQHIVFYCGTYAGFILTAIYGTTCILLHHGAGLASEVMITFLGALMHIIACIWSMYHAEGDVHLPYLSDFEEPLHPYFANCREQSIASLVCGCVYMLHCAFACDILFTKPSETTDWSDENYLATQTLRLYFISALIQDYLFRYKWFRKHLRADSRVIDSSAMHHDFVGTKARIKAIRHISRRSLIAFRNNT